MNEHNPSATEDGHMAENEKLGPLRPQGPLRRREEDTAPVIEVQPAEADTFSSLRAYWDIMSRRRW